MRRNGKDQEIKVALLTDLAPSLTKTYKSRFARRYLGTTQDTCRDMKEV